MKTLTITEVVRKPNVLREALENQPKVRIIWKEAKPNGLVEFSAIIKKEGN